MNCRAIDQRRGQRFAAATILLLTVAPAALGQAKAGDDCGFPIGGDRGAFGAAPAAGGPHLVSGAARAPHRGVYEILVEAAGELGRPHFDPQLTVTFTRPDGSKVEVDGFYDGGDVFKARAYCDTLGEWSWNSSAKIGGLHNRSGTFEVVPSKLQGKLRKHPKDPHQFAYDNGEWFLHIGDTGYRYVVDTEPEWKAYIGQAAQAGFTKIRTWFCRSRSGVEALFTDGRSALDLAYWQEIDRRVQYALNHHPDVILKLIPYGEDTRELFRYGEGDRMSRLVARYAQARFSALPNVMWCISNDREIVAEGVRLGGRRVPAGVIEQIGRHLAAREPWGTLVTNHQKRGSGYAFVQSAWSDVVTIEDLDQVDGGILLEYRGRGDDPVVNDEDRYELYRSPKHPRYFFRRLMWASLLSGGHATYGGLRTYEPYNGRECGVRGYYDAKKEGILSGGADDFVHIHKFFADTGLTLVGMRPDDAAVGSQPRRAKCIHSDATYIVYLANPSGDEPETDHAGEAVPTVSIRLPEQAFGVRWFNPRGGAWTDAAEIHGLRASLQAPGGGDWVLLLRARRALQRPNDRNK